MPPLALLSLSLAALVLVVPAPSSPAPQDDGAAKASAAAAPARTAPEPLPAELLALFDYDREADLAIEEAESTDFGAYRRADLSYASPAGGRVPAYLYEPTGEGPYAGILLMHGMPGDRGDAADLGARYARAGAVVLAISAPWARPDGPREDVLHFTPSDRDEQIQLIQDLRRGLDLFEELPWVDRERFGYVGGSYGGAMGGLLAGVEERIGAFALMIGDGGLVAHFTGPDDEGRPEHVTPERWQTWLELMRPIEPLRFVAHAAPRQLLFQNGRTDRMVPAADAEAYHAAASEPKTVRWYETGHAVTMPMLKDQSRWMSERLGLDLQAFGFE